MPDLNSAPAAEDLGYFYDTVHGRVALEDLPERFRPTLKLALSSSSLARLKRVSQLGHTSVSFFSATHTRFSHAIGTMLVMNKLFRHVSQRGLSESVFDEVQKHYSESVATFANARDMVFCHLLLAALYQDTGELPFQKVSSLYFVPVEGDISNLVDRFPKANPREWSTKKLFSVLSLWNDSHDGEDKLKDAFKGYDLGFIVYLITGHGAPAETKAIEALLQMVDGVIDADRLDYVYRDAAATIGSLSRPITVLESIVGYEPGRVVVNDSRPATDFLSTRMRLWTFVYSSADVRFRQVLLKTLLEGRWDSSQTEDEFKSRKLEPELSHKQFMELDDNSLMERIEKLNPDKFTKAYRQHARTLLLRGGLDYECRLLKRGKLNVSVPHELPADMFFDLLSDHGHHQLYRGESVFVRQGLTSKIADEVRLEESAGAFSPLFARGNSATLVADGFYVFLPHERQGGRWPEVKQAMDSGDMYPLVNWEDARRAIPPTDTRNTAGFNAVRSVSLSFCSEDFPTVVRIVRELHRRKIRYRLFLQSFDGIGDTPSERSKQLINEAEAVLAVVSSEYLRKAVVGKNYVAIEVSAMHDRAKNIPIVPLGVDRRSDLQKVVNWAWRQMNEDWHIDPPVLSEDFPLRSASEEILRSELTAALKAVGEWTKKP